jgi:hypothetical protein
MMTRLLKSNSGVTVQDIQEDHENVGGNEKFGVLTDL